MSPGVLGAVLLVLIVVFVLGNLWFIWWSLCCAG